MRARNSTWIVKSPLAVQSNLLSVRFFDSFSATLIAE